MVLIDTPPGSASAIDAAIDAADLVIIPTGARAADIDRVWPTLDITQHRPTTILLTFMDLRKMESVEMPRSLAEANAPVLPCIVRDLTKAFGDGDNRLLALKKINVEINPGELTLLVGPSGCGKTTLISIVAGLLEPTEGHVEVLGKSLESLRGGNLVRFRGDKIGFVFQSYQLVPTLTAFENVLLPYELNARGDGRARAAALLASVGLADRTNHYPVQLSGGEQQRVALARAFVIDPPIVLADEPTGNLDSTNGEQVLKLLTERQREGNTTLVMVTHDPLIAARADRRIHLRDGLVVADELVAVSA